MHYFLFDIDGTLLETGGAGMAAMAWALQTEFGEDGDVNNVSFAGRTDRAIATDLFEHYGIDNNEENIQRFLAAYFNHLPAQLAAKPGRLLPGVTALLESLDSRDDVTLGLLTGNFREGARLKLSHYEINHFFHFGGFGDHHYDRDDVARLAAEEVRRHHNEEVLPERMWVIGDTPADVRCARAIGATVVAVGTGMYSVDELAQTDPDHVFADFADHSGLLALLPVLA